MSTETESNLVRHAREELQRAGLFDTNGDYGGMLGTEILKLVQVFSEQGHSGFSAQMTIDILDKLLRFQPLTPITNNPVEWMEVSDNLWQNRRQGSLFSHDAGKTWYDTDKPRTWPWRMRLRRVWRF
jgi:hypothetical protein